MNPITVVFISSTQCLCLFLSLRTPGSCVNGGIDNIYYFLFGWLFLFSIFGYFLFFLGGEVVIWPCF